MTEFTILGGPLHQVGRRLGLVRGDTDTVPLGLALGPGVWLVVLVLSLVEGVSDRFFVLEAVGAHARLLLVIPLFFICESWVAPQMTAFVRGLAATGLVPAASRPALDAEVARVRQSTDAWWPDALCLIAVVAIAISGGRLQSHGASGVYDPSRPAVSAWVYYRIGLTLFQFLLFRWGWRLLVWGRFLWRVSRLELRLMPGHPDLSGGLARLSDVHERFTPLVAAISVLECASLTEDLLRGTTTMAAVYPWLATLLIVDIVLFVGPVVVFTDKLWASRTQGIRDYMAMASRYVGEFEAKWLTAGATSESLVGSPDLQSLADLGSSVDVVRRMRWLPVGPRLWIFMSVAALVPLAPLLLFQYPFGELVQRFFTRLVGL
jgi:hypothetical protein